MKKIYIIGVWWIGISWLARYYYSCGYEVHGSDSSDSELTQKLAEEGIFVQIGIFPDKIDTSFDLVVYSGAIPTNHAQLQKAQSLGIATCSYSEALAHVANTKKLIAVAGSHGKSTTTALVSLVLKNSSIGVNALVGSLLKEFDGKNTHFSGSPLFVLEACEYKRQFLAYRPHIGIVTNIDLDHLDYYKDEADYVQAFEQYIENIVPQGFAILDANDMHTQELAGKRTDIEYILVDQEKYTYFYAKKSVSFPEFSLQVPGEHILFDAKIAFTVGNIFQISQENIINTLTNYTGIWRRSEIVGETPHQNMILSDYGHHPKEISLTLWAIKKKYTKKMLVVIFQPHQYSRTLELLEDFKNCFSAADVLLVTDIYESRDSQEDKEKMDAKRFTQFLNHPRKIYTGNLDETLQIWNMIDQQHPQQILVVLQWAGDVDTLREGMKKKEEE